MNSAQELFQAKAKNFTKQIGLAKLSDELLESLGKQLNRNTSYLSPEFLYEYKVCIQTLLQIEEEYKSDALIAKERREMEYNIDNTNLLRQEKISSREKFYQTKKAFAIQSFHNECKLVKRFN